MKIRSINELQDFIDDDLGWRKKELTALMSNIRSARSFAKVTAIRSGITLLYAHWEGTVKNIATYYLCFVACQKFPYKQLKRNFLALSAKEEVRLFDDTNKATLHNKILNSLFEKNEQKSDIPYENIIKTSGNLKSEIFKEIMTTIGLDYSQYESSFTLVDEVLLNMRNHIAHGEKLEVLSLDEKRFEEMYKKIIWLIDAFAIQVSNAASTKQYLADEYKNCSTA